jgi:hypothetical protein
MDIAATHDRQTTMRKKHASVTTIFYLGLVLLGSCRPVANDDIATSENAPATTTASTSVSKAPIQPQAPATVPAT